MAVKLKQYGYKQSLGAVIVKFSYDSSILPRDILDEVYWDIEVYDGGWTTSNRTEIIQIVQPDMDRYEFQIRYRSEGGTLRATCSGTADIDGTFDQVSWFDSDSNKLSLCIQGYYFDNTSDSLAGIPYAYFSGNRLISNISQSLDIKEGITSDGSLLIELTDIDGDLTSKFAPAKTTPISKLDVALSDTDTTIDLVDASDFPSSGYLWINKETLQYTGKSSNQLTGVTHEKFRSVKTSHDIGDMVYGFCPNFVNRSIWLEDSSQSVLWSGYIVSLTPDSNMANYVIKAKDTMAALDVEIGNQLGYANVERFIVTDREYSMRFTDSYSNFAILTLPVGIYDYSYLITVLNDLYVDAVEEYEIYDFLAENPFSIQSDNTIRIDFSFSSEGVKIEAEYPNNLLEILGFKSDSYVVPNDLSDSRELESVFIDFVAYIGGYIESDEGLSPISEKITSIPFSSDMTIADNGNSFTAPGIMQIGEEVISFGQVSNIPTSIISTTLSDNITASSQVIHIADASNFESTNFIDIGTETIFVISIDTGLNRITDCVRGANGTTAAIHSSGATVTKRPYGTFSRCERGIYGTNAVIHDSGDTINELITSDKISVGGLLLPSARFVSPSPFEFIVAMLGNTDSNFGVYSSVPNYSLMLNPTYSINTDSFVSAFSSYPYSLDRSFLAVLSGEETFREVIARIARAIGYFIYADDDGKISIDKFGPVLSHQSNSIAIISDDIISIDSVKWNEDDRISRVVIEHDYLYGKDEYKTKLNITDKTKPNDSFLTIDHTAKIEAKEYHGPFSRTKRGGNYSIIGVDTARRWFRLYNRFLQAISFTTDETSIQGVQIGNSIDFTHPSIPSGDGTRGLSSATLSVIEVDKNRNSNLTKITGIVRPSGKFSGFNVSMRVVSFDAVANTITCANTYVFDSGTIELWDDSDTPDTFITSGDFMLSCNMTSGTYTAYKIQITGTIPTAWVANQATFDVVAVTPGVAVGDVVKSIDYNDSANVQKNLCFISDSNGKLGTANDDGYEYSY